MYTFTHLMIGDLTHDQAELEPYAGTHTILHKVQAYSGIKLTPSYPFVSVETKDVLWILTRMKHHEWIKEPERVKEWRSRKKGREDL